MKVCPRCEIAKSHEEFYRRNGQPSSYCKPCHKAYYRERWASRPDVRERVSARQSSLSARQRRAERLYGMAPGGYQRLWEQQSGKCAICRRPATSAELLPVDHNHDTGRVRGLLCHSCNRGIGLLGDSATRLRAAAAYLEGHK